MPPPLVLADSLIALCARASVLPFQETQCLLHGYRGWALEQLACRLHARLSARGACAEDHLSAVDVLRDPPAEYIIACECVYSEANTAGAALNAKVNVLDAGPQRPGVAWQRPLD